MKLLLLFLTMNITQDSLPVVSDSSKVILAERIKTPVVHSPRRAAVLSACVPGLGQIYNKKYWKLPLVYAGLGTCAGFFFYNVSEYNDARKAYQNKLDGDPSNDNNMPEKYRPVDPESIRRYRNGVRQNVDYSVLAFLLCWGLNVVDAAVDAHLKTFDLSDNLSLHINPYMQPANGSSGVKVLLDFGRKKNQTSIRTH
jgi:hypothetical protein